MKRNAQGRPEKRAGSCVFISPEVAQRDKKIIGPEELLKAEKLLARTGFLIVRFQY